MEFRAWLISEQIRAREDASGIELTYDDPEAKGSIYALRDNENPNIYRVTRVWVKPEGMGHGKRLYLAAMEAVTKRGGMLAPAKNSTSDSASKVWRSLYSNPNVKKAPLAARDWPMTSASERAIKKYPGLRLADTNTHPPKTDSEFWTFHSGYRLEGSAPKIQRRTWPAVIAGSDELTLEDL